MINIEESNDSAMLWSGNKRYIDRVIAHARGLLPCCKRRNILGFFFNAMTRPALYAQWFDHIEDGLPPGLPFAISRHLLERTVRRYLRCWFSPREKMNILRCHYNILEARLPPTVLKRIYKYPEDAGVLLAELTGKSGHVYQIILRQSVNKEGEIGIRFVDSRHGDALAELRGTFGPGEDDSIVYWIGAIQGPLFPQGREAISAATRDLNGLRPKHAVLHAACALCMKAGVDTIYAPPHANHVSYRWWRPWFTRHKILSDYDGFWQEFTTEKTARGDFRFSLPLARRKLEDVQSKRRKDWLQRYARIDALTESTTAQLNALSDI